MPKELSIQPENELFDTQYFDNPYPTFVYLRKNDPVHWSDDLNSWVVTRYNDVVNGLKDPRLIVKREKVKFKALSQDQRQSVKLLEEFFSNWLLYIDPPDHIRIRGAVNRTFSPTAIEQRRVTIESIIGKQLDAIEKDHGVDLLHDFSIPVSIKVIASTLGEKPEDYKKIIEWTDDIMGFFHSRKNGYDALKKAQKSFDDFSGHVKSVLFSPDSTEHSTDVLGALRGAIEEGTISKQEAESIYGNILFDGQEPISNGITNGFYGLLINQEQRELLARRPDLIALATEELLRYESPFQLACRIVGEDISYQGKTFKKGQKVYLMLASANRDPEHFQNPDDLNIERTDRQYAFGYATHFCLGASLARATLQTAYLRTIERFPNMRLAVEKLEWQPYFSIRELKKLPVQI